MPENLDHLCAKHGQNILEGEEDQASNYKTQIQKVLGILQEDGLFAFAVFLESEGLDKIQDAAKNLLNDDLDLPEQPTNTLREDILEITNDMDNMFLTKDLLERMLTYALFRAKAME